MSWPQGHPGGEKAGCLTVSKTTSKAKEGRVSRNLHTCSKRSVCCDTLMIFQDIETPGEDSMQEPSADTQVQERISGLWLNVHLTMGRCTRAVCHGVSTMSLSFAGCLLCRQRREKCVHTISDSGGQQSGDTVIQTRY